MPTALLWLALPTACAEYSTDSSRAQQRRQIQTDFVATLERCRQLVPASRALIGRALGVLIFPTVVVLDPVGGARSGSGALRLTNVFDSYYQLTGTGTGADTGNAAQAGSQSFVFLFMSWAAINRFRDHLPWRPEAAAPLQVAPGGHRSGPAAQADTLVLVLDDHGVAPRRPLTGLLVTPLGI